MLRCLEARHFHHSNGAYRSHRRRHWRPGILANGCAAVHWYHKRAHMKFDDNMVRRCPSIFWAWRHIGHEWRPRPWRWCCKWQCALLRTARQGWGGCRRKRWEDSAGPICSGIKQNSWYISSDLNFSLSKIWKTKAALPILLFFVDFDGK